MILDQCKESQVSRIAYVGPSEMLNRALSVHFSPIYLVVRSASVPSVDALIQSLDAVVPSSNLENEQGR